MHKVTIELPDAVTIRTVKGKAFNVETAKVPANVLAALVEGGMKIIGNNVWNGGGKDVQEADRLAALEKRVKAWYAGQYAIVEREGGQQLLTVAFEAWRDKMASDNGVTQKVMDDYLAGMVKDAFGKDAKLSADNKINAACKALAAESKTDAETERTAWNEKWMPIAEAKLADEAAAKAKLDVSKVKLTLK